MAVSALLCVSLANLLAIEASETVRSRFYKSSIKL